MANAAVIQVGPATRLRRWHASDLDDLLRHADDAEVSRGLSERFPSPYTHADGEAFLRGDVLDFANPTFAIEIDGKACGGIGARPFAGDRGVGAEFGYWLGRAHWGRGVMSRVVGVFAPWAMQKLSLRRLQATVLDFNRASARVLQKNGFVEEGVMRQAVRKHGRLHDLRLFARISEGGAGAGTAA